MYAENVLESVRSSGLENIRRTGYGGQFACEISHDMHGVVGVVIKTSECLCWCRLEVVLFLIHWVGTVG